jgi:hypothetical protein
MSEDNSVTGAIKIVEQNNPEARNFRIVDVKSKFLQGSLYTIAFDATDKAGETHTYTNRVYVVGSKLTVFRNDELLLSIVGQTHGQSLLDKIFSTDVISGFVGIIIVLVACYMLLFGSGQVPDLLGNAVTIILGFYFGRATAKNAA